ncbi:TonB-dependent receptor [Pseudomonas gingeri]
MWQSLKGRTALGLVYGAILSPGLGGSSAMAEEPPQATLELQSITVTARKREETEQQVPVSMSVITPEQARSIAPASSNADLARQVPNFNYMESGGQYSNSGNIRGVGSFSPLSADDTSIVFNVDEVPVSAYGVPPALLDIERVEVLRGPQGTLYGRNTQGGAINVVPNRPSFEHEGSVRVEGGSRGYTLGELISNEALSDNVAGRLAMRYSEQGGDIANRASGGKDGASQISALRGSLLFVPNDDTRALLTFSYNQNDDDAPRFILRSGRTPDSGLNPRNDFSRESSAVNLRVTHDLDWAQLTSLSSIQYSTFRQRMDMVDSVLYSALTGLPQAAFNGDTDRYRGTLRDIAYLQEFRLASLEDSYVQWVTGVNLWHSQFTAHTDGEAFTQPRFAVFSGQQKNDFSTDSYSLFGEATVPLTERLKATLGLRGTHEGKEASYRYSGGDLGTVSQYRQNASMSDNFLTGRGSLSYDWSDSFMTYVSVGRGVVGADYSWNSSNIPFGRDEQSFEASKSWTYELGFKSLWWEDRLSVNGALFYNDVKDGHLYVYNGVNYQPVTVDYDSAGAELEARLKLTERLSVNAGAGYTHAELKNVQASVTALTRGATSGNQVPNVPEYSANLGLDYRVPAEQWGVPLSGELYGSVDYHYLDKRAADVANSFYLGSYDLTNARVGWQNKDYGVYLFGNNLFDRRYEAMGAYYSPTVQAVKIGTGRTVGVGLTANF